jgi:hypothetical protein
LPPPPSLVEHLPETGIAADVLEVLVSEEVLVVAISQVEGLLERLKRPIDVAEIGATAREIVVRGRILRGQRHDALVDLERLSVPPARGKGLTEHLKRVDAIGIDRLLALHGVDEVGIRVKDGAGQPDLKLVNVHRRFRS